jgi:hypothetical protein
MRFAEILAIGPPSVINKCKNSKKGCKNSKKGLSNSEFWQIPGFVISRFGEMLLILTLIFLCTYRKGLAEVGKLPYFAKKNTLVGIESERRPSLQIVNKTLNIRWDILQPNRGCLLESLENSNIEELLGLNQQQGKILLVLVVALSYDVRFIAPMTFCVLSMLIS